MKVFLAYLYGVSGLVWGILQLGLIRPKQIEKEK